MVEEPDALKNMLIVAGQIAETGLTKAAREEEMQEHIDKLAHVLMDSIYSAGKHMSIGTHITALVAVLVGLLSSDDDIMALEELQEDDLANYMRSCDSSKVH